MARAEGRDDLSLRVWHVVALVGVLVVIAAGALLWWGHRANQATLWCVRLPDTEEAIRRVEAGEPVDAVLVDRVHWAAYVLARYAGHYPGTKPYLRPAATQQERFIRAQIAFADDLDAGRDARDSAKLVKVARAPLGSCHLDEYMRSMREANGVADYGAPG